MSASGKGPGSRSTLVPRRDDDAAVESTRAAIEVVGVSRTFSGDEGDFVALQDVSLDIRPGEFVCLVGPSGCGKSTLLNIIAGIVSASAGNVTCLGNVVDGPNTAVGYMTQQDDLLPWRTLRRNIMLPLELRKVPKNKARLQADEVLDEVGLLAAATRFPSQLSGGMRKRAALARMLVYRPEIMLMDEPFGAIDAQLRMSLHRQLLEVWERHRTTVVFVTHDLEEALTLADKIVVFRSNPGRVVHVEDVPFERPRDPFVLRSDSTFWKVWGRLWDTMGASA